MGRYVRHYFNSSKCDEPSISFNLKHRDSNLDFHFRQILVIHYFSQGRAASKNDDSRMKIRRYSHKSDVYILFLSTRRGTEYEIQRRLGGSWIHDWTASLLSVW